MEVLSKQVGAEAGGCGLCGDCNFGCSDIKAALEKLKAYESTGLTPEEMHELLHHSTGPLHKKIGDWIKADLEDRIVELPCKVGDSLYRIVRTKAGKTVRSDRIEEIQLGKEGRVYLAFAWHSGGYEWVAASQIGKTVFLTSEAAMTLL